MYINSYECANDDMIMPLLCETSDMAKNNKLILIAIGSFVPWSRPTQFMTANKRTQIDKYTHTHTRAQRKFIPKIEYYHHDSWLIPAFRCHGSFNKNVGVRGCAIVVSPSHTYITTHIRIRYTFSMKSLLIWCTDNYGVFSLFHILLLCNLYAIRLSIIIYPDLKLKRQDLQTAFPRYNILILFFASAKFFQSWPGCQNVYAGRPNKLCKRLNENLFSDVLLLLLSCRCCLMPLNN